MITLESFLPYVLPSASNCPEPLAIQALRNAAIDFCTRTDLIQRVFTPNVIAGTATLAIDVPNNMTVGRVMEMYYKDSRMHPATPDGVRSPLAMRGANIGDATIVTGYPRFYFQTTPDSDTFNVYPVPDATAALTAGYTLRVSFVPDQECMTVDDTLFDDYAEDIANGALARILMTPGQSFTSVTASAAYRSMFEGAIKAGRRQTQMGYTNGAQRIAPRPFA